MAGLPGLVIGDAASFLLGAALIALVRSDAGRAPDRQADRAPEAAHSPGIPTLAAPGWCGSGWMGSG